MPVGGPAPATRQQHGCCLVGAHTAPAHRTAASTRAARRPEGTAGQAHGKQPVGLAVVQLTVQLGCWDAPRQQRTERHARCLGRGLPVLKMGNYGLILAQHVDEGYRWLAGGLPKLMQPPAHTGWDGLGAQLWHYQRGRATRPRCQVPLKVLCASAYASGATTPRTNAARIVRPSRCAPTSSRS
jgi:hypothetical protein